MGACNVFRIGGGNVPPPPAGAPPPHAYAYAVPQAVMPPPPPMVPMGQKGKASGKGGMQRIFGTMSAVKDGWGFISSPNVAGDVFLGLRDNPQLTSVPAVGEELTFEVVVDPKSGRHKALSAEL